jgi:hypothetical protein
VGGVNGNCGGLFGGWSFYFGSKKAPAAYHSILDDFNFAALGIKASL